MLESRLAGSTLIAMNRPRTTYTPDEKANIIKGILSRKLSIQKIAKEKGIAPTLISLWKKQAEDAITARFQPQPKGRKKTKPTVAPALSDSVRSVKNELRKIKIKAAHLEASLKDARTRLATTGELLESMAATMGFKLVKVRTSSRGRKAKSKA